MGSSKYDKELEKAYADLKKFEKDRKKEKNELMSFFAGLLMFGAGLYMILQNVSVTSSLGGSTFFHIGSYNMPNGLVMLPLILGIAMMFMMDRKVWGGIVFALGVVIILAAIIMSVHIHWRTSNAYVFIIMFTLCVGGGGMMLKELLRKK